VSPFWKDPGCGSCYDFAIKERYPAGQYCEPDAFSSLESQHQPLPPSDPHHTVAFFREPSERLLSAAVNRHTSGFHVKNVQALHQQCYAGGLNPHCFANYPGVKGCMARMLTGGYCADDGASMGNAFHVDVHKAVEAVKQLAYVGLTEEWNEAVCLFHKMFGGRVQQAEFKNFHPTGHEKPDVDIADPFDDPVYAAAKQRFRELQQQYGTQQCHREVAMPTACEPTTCEKAGAECGSINDGCGGVLVCGNCPQHRAGAATCSTHVTAGQGAAAPGVCNTGWQHAPDIFKVSTYRAHGVHLKANSTNATFRGLMQQKRWGADPSNSHLVLWKDQLTEELRAHPDEIRLSL